MPAARICVRFSRSIPALRLGISKFDHITSLVIQTPNGLFREISWATERHVEASSSSVVTLLTRPIRFASAESTTLPVSINSQAREAPISRGNIQLTPISHPEIPSRTNAVPNFAEAPQYLISLAHAMANPPPAAAPLIAAIIGCRVSRM